MAQQVALALPLAPQNPAPQDFTATGAFFGELVNNHVAAQVGAAVQQGLQQGLQPLEQATQAAQAAAGQAAAQAAAAQAAAQAAQEAAQAAREAAQAAQEAAQALPQLLQQVIAPLQQAIAPMQQQLGILLNRTSMAYRLAVQHNGHNLAGHHTLQPVPHPDTGAMPPNFPATNDALDLMTTAQLGKLLAFYGQPAAGTKQNRRNRLKALIGQS